MTENVRDASGASNEELARAYRNGDMEAGEKLLVKNTGLCKKIASRYAAFAPFDDLLQEAYYGAIIYTLSHWRTESTWITGAFFYIRVYCRRCAFGAGGNRQIRWPDNITHLNTNALARVVLSLDDAPRGNNNTYGDLLPDKSRDDDLRETCAIVRGEVDKLPDEERKVIRARYWHSRDFATIGAELGVSREAARTRHNFALMKLSVRLASAM